MARPKAAPSQRSFGRRTTMLLLKFLLITAGNALLLTAAAMLAFDVYNYIRARQRIQAAESGHEKLTEPELKLRARLAGVTSGAGIALLLLASCFDVVPAGHAAIRVSQISGTEETTLYPGIHAKSPFECVVVYDSCIHCMK